MSAQFSSCPINGTHSGVKYIFRHILKCHRGWFPVGWNQTYYVVRRPTVPVVTTTPNTDQRKATLNTDRREATPPQLEIIEGGELWE